VSDMGRNRFFSWKTPQANDGNTGMFHNLPVELQLTAVTCAMEHAPDTRESNTNDLACQLQAKQDEQELAKRAVLAGASDECTECLIHHMLGESERFWRTPIDAKEGLKSLGFKKDKELVLQDNINIPCKGHVWED